MEREWSKTGKIEVQQKGGDEVQTERLLMEKGFGVKGRQGGWRRKRWSGRDEGIKDKITKCTRTNKCEMGWKLKVKDETQKCEVVWGNLLTY